jgi:hypothetical protein
VMGNVAALMGLCLQKTVKSVNVQKDLKLYKAFVWGNIP